MDIRPDNWYTSAIPATKLMMPPMQSGFLPRFQLRQRLGEAMRYRVVFLTASAGYGKTAALCDFLSHCGRPVAWLTLGKRDNNVFDFWYMVVCAIRRVSPGFGLMAEKLLLENGTDVETVLSALINELVEKLPRLILVLDNYHVIRENSIHVSLEYLMRFFPPEANLIIASRSRFPLSLSALRGQGQLAELGTDELRFSPDDTYSFLSERLSFPVTKPMVRDISRRFDGWITGLRMAAIAMEKKPSVASQLSISEQSENEIMDFLTSEALDTQDDNTRDFLLRTSIFHSFCAELCDCVLSRTDSGELIDSLLSRELFIQAEAEDAGGRWFRYHPIFKDALRRQLTLRMDDCRKQLNSSASLWAEGHGRLEEALEYALEAEEFERAGRLLDKIVVIILGQDRYDEFWSWLHRLPEKLVNSNLGANIASAVSCEMTRASKEQRHFVQNALKLSEELDSLSASQSYPDADNLNASLCVLRIIDAYHNNQADSAIAIADQSIAVLPQEKTQGRCAILCMKGFALWLNGELAESYKCCREAAFLGMMSDWSYSVCLNLSATAHALFEQGDVRGAEDVCTKILAFRDTDGGEISSACYAHLLLARIHYQRDELSAAESQLRLALELSDRGREPIVWFISQMELARIQSVSGRTKEAMDTALLARLTFEASISDSMLSEMLYARLLLLSSDPEATGYLKLFGPLDSVDWSDVARSEALLKQYILGRDVRNVWDEVPILNYARIRLELRQYEGLCELLAAVHRYAQRRDLRYVLTETQVLEALAAEAAGDHSGAMLFLEGALKLTAESGHMRVYADEGKGVRKLLRRVRPDSPQHEQARRLLSLMGDVDKRSLQREDTPAAPALGFTDRELQLLQMICTGCTNQEIASRLFLSLSTVKNHTHSIYGKMGVSSRAQAIIKARELGLLPDE